MEKILHLEQNETKTIWKKKWKKIVNGGPLVSLINTGVHILKNIIKYNQSVYKNNYTLSKRSLLESYKATSILENKLF